GVTDAMNRNRTVNRLQRLRFTSQLDDSQEPNKQGYPTPHSQEGGVYPASWHAFSGIAISSRDTAASAAVQPANVALHNDRVVRTVRRLGSVGCGAAACACWLCLCDRPGAGA